MTDPDNAPPAPPATFDPAAVAAVVTAYRRAVAALDALGAALEAAGIDAGTDAQETRRRALAAARQARLRQRRGGVTSDAALRREEDAPSRARAFLIEEYYKNNPDDAKASSAPLSVTGSVTAAAPPASASAPSLGATATDAAPAPPGHRRERPAVARRRKNDPRPDSGPVAGDERAPRAVSVENDPVAVVWAAYSAATVATVRLTPARRALIERRLSEGWTATDLARACEGYARSPWHRGDNPNGRPYQALELWLRDAAHIEAGQAMIDRPAPVRPGRPALAGIADAWEAEQAAADAATTAATPDDYDPFLAYS